MKTIVGQVVYVFMFMLRIHEDKLRARRRNERSKGIYSGKSFKFYLNKSIIFVKWCRKHYGIKLLIELNQEMCKAFFRDMIIRGLSPWTLHSYRSAISWLERGIPKAFHRRVKIVPNNMVLPERSLNLRNGRYPYSHEEVVKIMQHVGNIDKDAMLILCFQYRYGLRISEALNLRYVDLYDNKILVVWYGKGGKLRIVTPINDDCGIDLILEKLEQDHEEKQKLFPKLNISIVCSVLKQACKEAGINVHKSHNIRSAYAVKKYEEFKENGVNDKEARTKTSGQLGHGPFRVDVSYSYIPPRIYPRK